MKIKDKYIAALKSLDDYATVSEWAEKFSIMFPDDFQRAEKQALNQAKPSTGLREIAARMSALLSDAKKPVEITIDHSERPRRVKYISTAEASENNERELSDDLEPLRRQDIINNAKQSLDVVDVYRMGELENIQRAFKQFFGLDFEIDHAEALLSQEKQGEHHPENLQLLLKFHNGKKNNNNWKRFSFEEQSEYIKKAIELQSSVAQNFGIEISNKIMSNLLKRLKEIY